MRESPLPAVMREELVQIALEEYRQMHALVLYRLQVLDQRIPLTTAALTAALGSVVVMPELLQFGLLVGVPLAATAVCLSTFNHARSLQDAISRVADIESSVNRLMGREVLAFQSTHPGRNSVGARTGRLTSDLVLAACLILFACSFFLAASIFDWPSDTQLAHLLLLFLLAAKLSHDRLRLKTYRYLPRQPARERSDQ